MRRRTFLKSAVAGVSASVLVPSVVIAAATGDIRSRLGHLERRYGGRLGVAMRVAGGRIYGYRSEQRFLMCSTFKLVLVAAVLERVDRGREHLGRRLLVRPEDLLDYAPVTRQHVGPPGMTVSDLCRAAIMLSDNTAANLLLDTVGGPAGVTACLRRWGDPVTRLDRREPELNRSTGAHDLRDTTTPSAMLDTMGRILFGDVLTPASRERLRAWMHACTTGTTLLRAGLPPGWQAGDKTGSSFRGQRNDLAFALPPHRAPLLAAAFYMPADSGRGRVPEVLASVGRIMASL